MNFIVQLCFYTQILNWFVQLCLALKHVHDRKILHRDIKSQVHMILYVLLESRPKLINTWLPSRTSSSLEPAL